jgi:signal transduction histidine kinase
MKIQKRSSFMLLGALVLITALLFVLLRLYRQRKVNMMALREQNNLVMQQTKDLQNLNEVKDRLLSMISHDFRSPLLTLHAMLELVEMGKNSELEMQELNTKVRRHLQETLSTLDNIIYWSMSQMAGFRLKPEKIHLAEFAEAWLKPLQAEMQSKNIALNLEVNPVHEIESDREVLSLVFRNLLTNAVKFSHAGGTIYVSSAKEEQAMVLSVRDEGIGISDEVLRKLQQQEHVTTLGTNHEKGTGMGLMLSRDLVKKLGGKIHIQREGGSGTRINLILPLSVQSEPAGRS